MRSRRPTDWPFVKPLAHLPNGAPSSSVPNLEQAQFIVCWSTVPVIMVEVFHHAARINGMGGFCK